MTSSIASSGNSPNHLQKFPFFCCCSWLPPQPSRKTEIFPSWIIGYWRSFLFKATFFFFFFQLLLNCFSFPGSLHRHLESVRLSQSSSLLVPDQMVSSSIHRYQFLIVCECILPQAQQNTLHEWHCKTKLFLSWDVIDCWILKKIM